MNRSTALAREPYFLVDQFDSTYWSGLSVSVYAGPFLLDEAVSIQFQVSESVTPYYGYANYTAQRMPRKVQPVAAY
jgi:hypothetical protein